MSKRSDDSGGWDGTYDCAICGECVNEDDAEIVGNGYKNWVGVCPSCVPECIACAVCHELGVPGSVWEYRHPDSEVTVMACGDCRLVGFANDRIAEIERERLEEATEPELDEDAAYWDAEDLAEPLRLVED